MTSLADSLVSSSSRRLPIRMRPDLVSQRQRYEGRIYWVVKDPVALQYYRFEEEEYAILQMLDGQKSLDEIAERFAAEFPPQTIRVEELQQFLGMLHRSGLVLTDAGGQGVQLKKRADEKNRKQLWGTLSNILSVRFRGIDPERILTWLHGYFGWFWSGPATIFNLLLISSAALLVLVQFDTFRAKLPEFHAFFHPGNWLLIGTVLAVTKVMHEFGHGLSCKHFGGECHEMGFMLLVLTPCLYCNVSDSWMLPNRWHRAAIGAAGMYVELVIASIATYLWWFSEPGFLNYVCLNIMFVSSVSTILFNANPLLRYDGYYILSDILEIPNLRQKASAILHRKLGTWCLGLEEQDDPFLPKRNQWLFALYTVAAAAYRWVVTLSILYFLNQVFEPYGLKILGQAIAVAALYGLLIQPLVQLFKYFHVPGRLGKVKRWRLVVTLLLLAGLVAALLLVPLPAHVYAPLEIAPRQADVVYVRVPGTLVELAPGIEAGVRVEAGQVLATLRNQELERNIAQLEGQLAEYTQQLRGLEDLSLASDGQQAIDARARIAATEQALAAAETQLTKTRADLAELTLRAPRAGVVLPPPVVTPRPHHPGDLPTWSGTPLDEENIGAYLEPTTPNGESTQFCLVGEPDWFEARLLVSQQDVDFVQLGQRVVVQLTQSPAIRYRSTVAQKAPASKPATPPRLSSLSGGPVATEVDPGGTPRPLEPVFEVVVPLPRDPERLRVGLTGEARISITPRTIGQRLWWYAQQTFTFDL